MISYPNQIKKINFLKSNYKQLKMKDCNKLNQQKNLKNKTKQKKKTKKTKTKKNWLTLSIEEMKHKLMKKLKA